MSECMIFYGPIVPEINYSILQCTKDSRTKRDEFFNAARLYFDQLEIQLTSRFPDDKVMKTFQVFNPKVANQVDSSNYSDVLFDCNGSAGIIDIEAAKSEWQVLNLAFTRAKRHQPNFPPMLPPTSLCIYKELSHWPTCLAINQWKTEWVNAPPRRMIEGKHFHHCCVARVSCLPSILSEFTAKT